MNKRCAAWGINLCVSPMSVDGAPGRSICGSLHSGGQLRKLILFSLSRKTQRIDPSVCKYRLRPCLKMHVLKIRMPFWGGDGMLQPRGGPLGSSMVTLISLYFFPMKLPLYAAPGGTFLHTLLSNVRVPDRSYFFSPSYLMTSRSVVLCFR